MDTERRKSYRVGARISRDRMAREAPEDHEALEAVEQSDIVVVRGQYDHVEWVLDALGLPHTTVEPGSAALHRLRPEQLLVVDCPGNIGRDGVEAVRRFVERGGSLFTTDWALRHVLEPAFPGVVEYNEKSTADAVVRVEVADHDNPFLKGVMDGDDDPQWWLEGSSYPIRVLDPDRVRVLIKSKELEEQWGEAPVAITFGHGEGEVFHMISHYYLQRTELRTRRHAAPAMAYAMEKGVALEPEDAAMAAELRLTDVESAATSSRMFANVAAAHKKRVMEREKKASTSAGSVTDGRHRDGREV